VDQSDPDDDLHTEDVTAICEVPTHGRKGLNSFRTGNGSSHGQNLSVPGFFVLGLIRAMTYTPKTSLRSARSAAGRIWPMYESQGTCKTVKARYGTCKRGKARYGTCKTVKVRCGMWKTVTARYGTCKTVEARYGPCKTVKAGFWPWLSGKSPEPLLNCSSHRTGKTWTSPTFTGSNRHVRILELYWRSLESGDVWCVHIQAFKEDGLCST